MITPIFLPMPSSSRREYEPPKCPKCGCVLPEPEPRARSVFEWVLRIVVASICLAILGCLVVGMVGVLWSYPPHPQGADLLVMIGMTGMACGVACMIAFGIVFAAMTFPDR